MASCDSITEHVSINTRNPFNKMLNVIMTKVPKMTSTAQALYKWEKSQKVGWKSEKRSDLGRQQKMERERGQQWCVMEDCSTDERLRQETLCHRQWTDEYVKRPEMLMRQDVDQGNHGAENRFLAVYSMLSQHSATICSYIWWNMSKLGSIEIPGNLE